MKNWGGSVTHGNKHMEPQKWLGSKCRVALFQPGCIFRFHVHFPGVRGDGFCAGVISEETCKIVKLILWVLHIGSSPWKLYKLLNTYGS